jgi:hypothetical protein
MCKWCSDCAECGNVQLDREGLTEARLDVVKRLRYMAAEVAALPTPPGPHIEIRAAAQQAIVGVMRGCIEQLEQEIRAAGEE